MPYGSTAMARARVSKKKRHGSAANDKRGGEDLTTGDRNSAQTLRFMRLPRKKSREEREGLERARGGGKRLAKKPFFPGHGGRKKVMAGLEGRGGRGEVPPIGLFKKKKKNKGLIPNFRTAKVAGLLK